MQCEAVVNFSPEPGSVELQKIDSPSIGKSDVLLNVAAVGVCGSDLHQWTSDHSWNVNYPVVLGHEFSGVIEECGEDVENWKPGDRVVSETAAAVDVDSPLTRQGYYNLDPGRKGFGYDVNGAMTHFVRVPARCLHRVPDSLAMEVAALTEPCCVAFNAVIGNAGIVPGDRVIVIGPGTIGILCAAMARLAGAEVGLLGLDQDRHRMKIAAKAYGCEMLMGGEAQDWATARDGLGADLVVDAAGHSATLRPALELIRPRGTISKVGWGPQPLDFNIDPLVKKNVRLQGSFSHHWAIWERILALLTSGALDVNPIIGGQWALAGWKDAFERMHKGEVVKSVLVPGKSA